MRDSKMLPVLILSLTTTTTALAQDEDPQTAFVYATYYICDQATQGNMDGLVASNEVPVFDQWVEDGRLQAWGYLRHFTGGAWRRAQYHVSSSLEDAFNNQAEIFGVIYEDNREGGQARAEACAGHDDYVWASNLGSPAGTERGAVSLSVYYVCSVADQQRADEIFGEIFGPLLDEAQQDGQIGTWSWMSHVLGGEYRRLQTMSGSDYATLARARVEALRRAGREHPALAREFDEICPTHVDYLWDIVHETP